MASWARTTAHQVPSRESPTTDGASPRLCVSFARAEHKRSHRAVQSCPASGHHNADSRASPGRPPATAALPRPHCPWCPLRRPLSAHAHVHRHTAHTTRVTNAMPSAPVASWLPPPPPVTHPPLATPAERHRCSRPAITTTRPHPPPHHHAPSAPSPPGQPHVVASPSTPGLTSVTPSANAHTAGSPRPTPQAITMPIHAPAHTRHRASLRGPPFSVCSVTRPLPHTRLCQPPTATAGTATASEQRRAALRLKEPPRARPPLPAQPRRARASCRITRHRDCPHTSPPPIRPSSPQAAPCTASPHPPQLGRPTGVLPRESPPFARFSPRIPGHPRQSSPYCTRVLTCTPSTHTRADWANGAFSTITIFSCISTTFSLSFSLVQVTFPILTNRHPPSRPYSLTSTTHTPAPPCPHHTPPPSPRIPHTQHSRHFRRRRAISPPPGDRISLSTHCATSPLPSAQAHYPDHYPPPRTQPTHPNARPRPVQGAAPHPPPHRRRAPTAPTPTRHTTAFRVPADGPAAHADQLHLVTSMYGPEHRPFLRLHASNPPR